MSKICTWCKCEHPLSYFSPAGPARPNTLRAWCKACVSEKSSEYYQKNKERCDADNRRRANQVPWKAVERKRRWRKDNPERARQENLTRKGAARKHAKMLKDNKLRIMDYLIEKYGNRPCFDCGVQYPWPVMDFDHRPGEIKDFAISTVSGRRASPELVSKVEKEISKCDLVCSNCHRLRTHVLRQHKTWNAK